MATEDNGLSATLPLLDRKQRLEQYGIDVGDGLIWEGGTWGPGGEYIKRLVVKNLSPKIVKLRYRLPKTKFFSMDFPDLFKLSPGTFKAIEVRFRPIRLEPYDDFVVFSMGRNRYFKVPICARLSKLAVALPPLVDFSLCPVAEITSSTFQLANVGQIPAAFTWDLEAPFSVSPARGVVQPGTSATITASFAPTNAAVLDAIAVCNVTGEQDSQTLRLGISGTGKYPFIAADAPRAEFGEVLIGEKDARKTQRTVVLSNPSDVVASFRIQPVESDREAQFTLRPMRGAVPPNGSVAITITYHPRSNGMFTCDHFDVVTPGGNTVRLTASGTARGPTLLLFRKEAPAKRPATVTPSGPAAGVSAATIAAASSGAPKRKSKPNSINFGDVALGETVTRVLFLQNLSNAPAAFHFQVEDKGVFTFDRIQGVIPPLLQGHIIVSFTPAAPINFYRRVFCLVRDQEPLYLDMVGTGYSQKRRPAPLLQRHVEAFWNRPAECSRLGPNDLEEWVEKHGRFDPSDQAVAEAERQSALLARSGQATLGPLDTARQWFQSPTDSSRPVVLHQTWLDFGHGSRGVVGERKAARITNRTSAKMTVVWQVPDSDDNDTVPDFAVSPESADIAPGATMEFKVSFMPSQNNFYYSQEIEAYAFFKTNRTFRLVNDSSFTPPYCMTVRTTGHTFALSAEQFMSRVSFSLPEPFRMAFPPAHVGDAVYQTFEMTNTHDTPAAFALRAEGDAAAAFDVKPACGLIPVLSSQLITVSFRPQLAKAYRGRLVCVLNNASDRATTVNLFGQGCVPRVTLEGAGVLHFKPTCLGVASTRTCKLHNTSRTPVRYEWKLPERYAAELAVQPASGILQGNEVLMVKWTFAPRRTAKYSLRVPCIITSTDVLHREGDGLEVIPAAGAHQGILANEFRHSRAGPMAQRLWVQAVGEGTHGALQFDPPALTFGTALVATKVTRQLVVENRSDVTLHFKMHIIRSTDLSAVDTDGDGVVEVHELAAAESSGTALATTKADRRRRKRLDGAKAAAEQVLRLSHPEGVVEARSRLTTTVTFAPGEAGEYGFRLFYEVTATHEHGLGSGGNQGAASELYHGSSRDAALRGVEVPRMLGDGGASAANGVTILNADPLWCDVAAKAGYPTMVWQDMRLISPATAHTSIAAEASEADLAMTAGSSTNRGTPSPAIGGGDTFNSFAPGSMQDLSCPGSPWRLWRQFETSELNAALATPLSAADLAFNRATQLKQRPEELETFTFEFTPAPHGSPPMTVLACVKNSGKLHTDFSFRLPNELEVELEPWAEVGEPTDEDLAQNAIIDAKIFDVQPRAGSLAAGESATLRLHYSYNSLAQGGRHQIYVILKLDKGKQVRLLLRGRTLPVNAPLLYLGTPARCHTFAPVPIGLVAPPRQSVPLYNPSGVPLRYMVDDGPLHQLTSDNYDFEVLRCLNRDGVLGAGESTTLTFVFRPLEAKLYDVNVDVVFTAVTGGDRGGFGDYADDAQEGDDPDAGGGIVTLALRGHGFRSTLPGGGQSARAAGASLAVGAPGLGMGNTQGLEEEDEDVDTVETVAAAKELARVLGVVTGEHLSEEEVVLGPGKTPQVGLGRDLPDDLQPVATIGSTPPDSSSVEYPEGDVPEAMAALSQEWLRFGDMPVGGAAYRVVVLRNTRPEGSVTFTWDTLHPLIKDKVLRVHPKQGRLAAGEHAVCKVTFSARCAPEVIHQDLACIIAVPIDEVRARAEREAAEATEAAYRKQKANLRNRSKVVETPHQSVMFRTTASRQAHLGAQAATRAASTAVKSRAGSRGTSAPPTASQYGGSRGGMTPVPTFGMTTKQSSHLIGNRAPTARSVRSRMSRGAMEQQAVVVPPAPTTTLVLHVNARVCEFQEFLLVHSRSRLAAFFMPKPQASDPAPIAQVLENASMGSLSRRDSVQHESKGVDDVAGAALQDVMAHMLADLLQEAEVVNAFDELPTDPVPLFGDLKRENERDRDSKVEEPGAEETDGVPAGVRVQALQGVECQELVERIIENTVLNIMKEASFGEFVITEPPVSLVRV